MQHTIALEIFERRAVGGCRRGAAGCDVVQSCTTRAVYSSQDRVDVLEAVKCLSRHVHARREGHMVALSRLTRYFFGYQRCALTFPRQATKGADLQAHGDSDWTGDLDSRRSTT